MLEAGPIFPEHRKSSPQFQHLVRSILAPVDLRIGIPEIRKSKWYIRNESWLNRTARKCWIMAHKGSAVAEELYVDTVVSRHSTIVNCCTLVPNSISIKACNRWIALEVTSSLERVLSTSHTNGLQSEHLIRHCFWYIMTFTVYVTACHLVKSFCFDTLHNVYVLHILRGKNRTDALIWPYKGSVNLHLRYILICSNSKQGWPI